MTDPIYTHKLEEENRLMHQQLLKLDDTLAENEKLKSRLVRSMEFLETYINENCVDTEDGKKEFENIFESIFTKKRYKVKGSTYIKVIEALK